MAPSKSLFYHGKPSFKRISKQNTPGSLSEAESSISPERNLSSSLCKGIYDPKRRGQKACSPPALPTSPAGRSCSPVSASCLIPGLGQAESTPPREAPLLGVGNPRLILGLSLQSGRPLGMRNGAEHQYLCSFWLLRTAKPARRWPWWGAEPCPALLSPGFSSAFNPCTKPATAAEYSLASTQSKEGCSCEIFFFLSLRLYVSG